MFRTGKAIALATAGLMALAGSAAAAEDWTTHRMDQLARIQVGNATGGKLQGGKPMTVNAYLRTRDIDSPRAALQPQAIATVDMTFPSGTKVNAIGKCALWPTNKPWDFKKFCASSKVGEGWGIASGFGTSALPRIDVASGGLSAPSISGNYSDSPPNCLVTDSSQYARAYEGVISYADPMLGASCLPLGLTWAHITAYAGMGNGAVNPTTGKVYDRTDPNKKKAAKITDKTALVFATDNGLAALSFNGTITTNPDKTLTLHVDLPAFNSAGLKGYLPLDTNLTDFRLVLNNSKFLTAGACPKSKNFQISVKQTYNPFPADYAKGLTSHYADQTLTTDNPC
jgi:hypothetical protein